MTACEAEALRYMGIHNANESMRRDVAQCMLRIRAEMDFRMIALECACQVGAGTVDAERIHIESHDLANHLQGCDKVALVAATLGLGVDRLIHTAFLTNSAEAVMLQACAAAALEDACDAWQSEHFMHYPGTRSRFSPGYGDFALTAQSLLLQALKASSRIGLTETASHMLTPTKSITAVVGITGQPCHNERSRCENCGHQACQYRKEGKRC